MPRNCNGHHCCHVANSAGACGCLFGQVIRDDSQVSRSECSSFQKLWFRKTFTQRTRTLLMVNEQVSICNVMNDLRNSAFEPVVPVQPSGHLGLTIICPGLLQRQGVQPDVVDVTQDWVGVQGYGFGLRLRFGLLCLQIRGLVLCGFVAC